MGFEPRTEPELNTRDAHSTTTTLMHSIYRNCLHTIHYAMHAPKIWRDGGPARGGHFPGIWTTNTLL